MTYNEFIERVESEHEHYIEEELRKPPRDIFYDSFRNYCINEIYYFFTENEYIPEENRFIGAANYFWIHNPGHKFIVDFYDYCINYDENPCNSWERLDETVNDYVREYESKKKKECQLNY